MRNTCKKGGRVGKMRHTWKNAPRLAKCITLGKMPHTWKIAQKLEKCTTLGKMRHA